MAYRRIEDFLEDPTKRHFHNLTAGLSGNLLTLGRFAGTFLNCFTCGKTFTLKGESWKCQCCGSEFGLKFGSEKTWATMPVTAKVTVSGLAKPSCTPPWHLKDENWSVAEFLMQILRLPSDVFFPDWLNRLGLSITLPAHLETFLFWPRLLFKSGWKKTLQPDFAVSFLDHLVLFEFKRPEGAKINGWEVAAEVAFAVFAGNRLGRDWSVVFIPGPDRKIRKSSEEYVADGLTRLAEAQEDLSIPQDVVDIIRSTSVDELGKRTKVVGWEELIRLSCDVIEHGSRWQGDWAWTRADVAQSLRYFQAGRSQDKLPGGFSAE